MNQLDKILTEKIAPKMKESISNLLPGEANVNIKKIKSVNLPELSSEFGPKEDLRTIVLLRVKGDIKGDIVFVYPVESALNLAHKLIGQEKKEIKEWTELERSAVKETCNIIAGSLLTALSDELGRNLIASVPGLTVDMLLAGIDVVLIDLAKDDKLANVLEIAFAVDGIEGYILYFLDEDSYQKLINSLPQ